MNDNKTKGAPLKRHPALVPLSKDHHFGLLLCWKIRMGMRWDVAPERMAKYTCYFFDQHLASHLYEEEEYVFSLLPQHDERRKEAERQHRRLRKLRLKLEEIPDRQATTLGQIEEELEAHIRFEERELFPYLQQRLSEDQLSQLKERLEATHHQVTERWDDPFWEKKQ